MFEPKVLGETVDRASVVGFLSDLHAAWMDKMM